MSRIQSIRMQFPLSIGMLLARDSIIGISIPSSIPLLASLFTRYVIHHPATNSLVAMLVRLIVMSITERAQRYLSETPFGHAGRHPVLPEQFRTPIPFVQYIDLHLRTTPELLVMSPISSGTPNSFGTSKLINS